MHPTDDMDHAQWAHTLAPWLSVLRGKLSLRVRPLPTRDEMESVWICFRIADPADYDPTNWTRLIEALELVDLLVRVDANVGWALLLDVASPSVVFMKNEGALFRRHSVRPRYELTVASNEIFHNFQTVFLALRRMIGEDDQPWEPPSPEFPSIQKLLLDVWKRQHKNLDFDRTRQGRIELKLQFFLCTDFRSQPVPFILDHTLGLAQASRKLLPSNQENFSTETTGETPQVQHAEQLVVRRRRAIFCFASFDFFMLHHRPTDPILRALASIHESALPITNLVLDQATLRWDETRQQSFSCTIDFLVRYLGNAGRGVKRFEFSSGCFDLSAVAAVCSGLANSPTVVEVAFTRSHAARADPENILRRSMWWPWLAYAIFSMDTIHNIRHATLDMEGFTMNDFRAMREVLQHDNALAFLCAHNPCDLRQSVLPVQPTVAVCRPATHWTIGHRCQCVTENDLQHVGSTTFTADGGVRVVYSNADEDFIEVVLPGIGVGWIDRENIQEIRPLCSRVANSVTSIELQAIPLDSRSAILALLGVIGGSLKNLTLSRITSPLDEIFMTSVCSLCPRLRGLRVNGDLVNARWLLSLTTSACSIELLELSGRVLDHQSLLAFVGALGSVGRGISKSLRAIHLNLSAVDRLHQVSVMKLCKSWLEMLRKNRQLERCELLVDGKTPTFNPPNTNVVTYDFDLQLTLSLPFFV